MGGCAGVYEAADRADVQKWLDVGSSDRCRLYIYILYFLEGPWAEGAKQLKMVLLMVLRMYRIQFSYHWDLTCKRKK